MSPPAKLLAAAGILLSAALFAWELKWSKVSYLLAIAAFLCFLSAIFYDPIQRSRVKAVYKAEARGRGAHIHEQLTALLGWPDPVGEFRAHMAEYVQTYWHDLSDLGFMDRRLGNSYDVQSVGDIREIRTGIRLAIQRLSPNPFEALLGWLRAKWGGHL